MLAVRHLLLAQRIQLFARAKAMISLAFLEPPITNLGVPVESSALEDRTLVCFQAQPLEPVEDRLDVLAR